jgi:hypothetical protein
MTDCVGSASDVVEDVKSRRLHRRKGILQGLWLPVSEDVAMINNEGIETEGRRIAIVKESAKS